MLQPVNRQNTHLFQAPTFSLLALETLGPISTSGITFFSEFGSRLTGISGDPRETSYLFQSLTGRPALQCGGIQRHIFGPH